MNEVVALVRLGRWLDALNALDHIGIPPEYPLRRAQWHHNRGVVLLRLGRRDEAADALQRAYSYDSSDVEACVLVGRLAIEGGKFDKGLEWLRRAQAAKPEREDVRGLIQMAERQCKNGN